MAKVRCRYCGDSSHPSSDCPFKDEKNRPDVDKDFLDFMADVDGKGGRGGGGGSGGGGGTCCLCGMFYRTNANAAFHQSYRLGAPPPCLFVPTQMAATSVVMMDVVARVVTIVVEAEATAAANPTGFADLMVAPVAQAGVVQVVAVTTGLVLAVADPVA